METIIKKLNAFSDVMALNPPITKEEKEDIDFDIPKPLMSLYDCFNGGEIFVPGTVIYGINDSNDGIQCVNLKLKGIFDIPKSYLIFGKLNYGDYVCINTEEPFDVVQWDHETNSAFYNWTSIKEWLEESIQDYTDTNIGGDLND